jgi:dipeptide/tripeptide permease
MALVALVIVLLFYRNIDRSGMGKSLKETAKGLVRVLSNVRFMILILITAGFWVIQGQLYATMPKYALRMIGEHAAPEWLANINPLVVVLLVVPITQLVRKISPIASIAIALAIIPFSALSVALSPVLEQAAGHSVNFGIVHLHPITVMLSLGIAFQGLSECFLSPRYLEFASRQAPEEEVGLYMGFSHLNIFFAWIIGFAVSGYLLDAFCPDPTTLPLVIQEQRMAALAGKMPMPEAYAHAHHIWMVFAVIGVVAFLLLLIYKWVTDAIDRKNISG